MHLVLTGKRPPAAVARATATLPAGRLTSKSIVPRVATPFALRKAFDDAIGTRSRRGGPSGLEHPVKRKGPSRLYARTQRSVAYLSHEPDARGRLTRGQRQRQQHSRDRCAHHCGVREELCRNKAGGKALARAKIGAQAFLCDAQPPPSVVFCLRAGAVVRPCRWLRPAGARLAVSAACRATLPHWRPCSRALLQGQPVQRTIERALSA